jgi:hypothetical protein
MAWCSELPIVGGSRAESKEQELEKSRISQPRRWSGQRHPRPAGRPDRRASSWSGCTRPRAPSAWRRTRPSRPPGWRRATSVGREKCGEHMHLAHVMRASARVLLQPTKLSCQASTDLRAPLSPQHTTHTTHNTQHSLRGRFSLRPSGRGWRNPSVKRRAAFCSGEQLPRSESAACRQRRQKLGQRTLPTASRSRCETSPTTSASSAGEMHRGCASTSRAEAAGKNAKT